jgi:DNA invertase Pin-like site-specific DNA recombinase
MNTPESLVEALRCGSVVGIEAPPAGKVKAFAWARVSTDAQEERGLSMPQQLREIRTYAEDHEIEIVEEFSEAASAFQREGKRVQFRRMIDRAKVRREVWWL